MKIGIGRGEAVQRLGARLRARSADPESPARRHCARRVRHGRRALRCRWRAWMDGATAIRWRSIRRRGRYPTRARRARGASEDRTTARISRFVSCPSCSIDAIVEPGSEGNDAAVRSGDDLERRPCSSDRRRRARSRRRCALAHALTRAAHALQHRDCDGAEPASVSRPASLRGVAPSQDSARMRAPGCRWRTMPSSARPCSVTVATSCSAQPMRAAASENADACGMHTNSSGPTIPPTACRCRNETGRPRRARSPGGRAA